MNKKVVYIKSKAEKRLTKKLKCKKKNTKNGLHKYCRKRDSVGRVYGDTYKTDNPL